MLGGGRAWNWGVGKLHAAPGLEGHEKGSLQHVALRGWDGDKGCFRTLVEGELVGKRGDLGYLRMG